MHSYSNQVVAGNKLLFVTNKFVAVGKDMISGGKYQTRLTATCAPGSHELQLEPELNWNLITDMDVEIALAPSGYDES